MKRLLGLGLCVGVWAAAQSGPHPRFTPAGPLDDPAALPGQIIVAGGTPGYLKYNGGGPAYLAGPDDPEAFLFLGELAPDGTRRNGPQPDIIRRLAATGVSAFHVQMFRMRRANLKNEGDDTHNPFLGGDPSKGLNPAVLDQWDGWLRELEKAGVVVILEFYNDFTDMARMGWTLDERGELHPDEERFVTGIVKRFQHRRNIIWSLAESSNKLSPARVPHFKKIAEVIARTDKHRHPIMQALVVPNDPDEDFPPGGALSDAYYGDPHIRLLSWLHLLPHGDDVDMQYWEYFRYWKRDSSHFIVLKSETFWRPYISGGRTGEPLGRRYLWAAAMAGLHNLEAQVKADRADHEPRMREQGYLARFMEQTDFYRMRPARELRSGSTRWVLADPGRSYILYSDNAQKALGVKELPGGAYELLWLDTVTGRELREQRHIGGGELFEKPAGFGQEVALWIRRR